MTEEKSWAGGWLDGFIAAAALFSGDRALYERMRNKYLDKAHSREEPNK